MKIWETYYICRTGKTKQFFTLYLHRLLVSACFTNESCQFLQNLSHDLEPAISKTKKIMEEKKGNLSHLDFFEAEMEFSDSKKREYCDLKAFGYNWKRTAKGFRVLLSDIRCSADSCESFDEHTYTKGNTPGDKKVSEFWDIWRENKDQLKAAGFSLFKIDYDWCFFFKNCTDEEMNIKFEVMKKAIDNRIIIGEFIGKLKERQRDLNVVLEKVTELNNEDFGTSYKLDFDYNGIKVVSYYYGSKEVPEEGKSLSLTGTVKSHKIYNGVKITTLNRIIF